METAEYERMYHLEGRYWWFRGRNHLVLSVLEKLAGLRDKRARAMDLGCGTGLVLSALKNRFDMAGLDFSPLALKYSRRRGVRQLIQGDVVRLPLQSEAFDLVTALDLMEHVEQDDELVREVRRILKPGGYYLVTVPAHPYLWSEHDEALHHKRRYTKPEFEKVLREGGLRIERLTYCISLTHPAIVTFRFLQRWLRPKKKPGEAKTHLIMVPRWLNNLLIRSIQFEAWLLHFMNIPFGVTLLAVARKEENPTP